MIKSLNNRLKEKPARKAIAVDPQVVKYQVQLFSAGASIASLRAAARVLQPQHYDEIVTERSGAMHLCGYPNCTQPTRSDLGTHSIRERQIVDNAVRRSFCSDACQKASAFYRGQLSVEPALFRSRVMDVVCLPAGSHGPEVTEHALRNLRKALEMSQQRRMRVEELDQRELERKWIAEAEMRGLQVEIHERPDAELNLDASDGTDTKISQLAQVKLSQLQADMAAVSLTDRDGDRMALSLFNQLWIFMNDLMTARARNFCHGIDYDADRDSDFTDDVDGKEEFDSEDDEGDFVIPSCVVTPTMPTRHAIIFDKISQIWPGMVSELYVECEVPVYVMLRDLNQMLRLGRITDRAASTVAKHPHLSALSLFIAMAPKWDVQVGQCRPTLDAYAVARGLPIDRFRVLLTEISPDTK